MNTVWDALFSGTLFTLITHLFIMICSYDSVHTKWEFGSHWIQTWTSPISKIIMRKKEFIHFQARSSTALIISRLYSCPLYGVPGMLFHNPYCYGAASIEKVMKPHAISCKRFLTHPEYRNCIIDHIKRALQVAGVIEDYTTGQVLKELIFLVKVPYKHNFICSHHLRKSTTRHRHRRHGKEGKKGNQ